MQRYTSEDIKAAIERASEMGNDRAVQIMADMKTQLDSRGLLSERQWDYLSSLIQQSDVEAYEDFKSFKEKFLTDEVLRKKIEVVADYYISKRSYYIQTAVSAKMALQDPTRPMPSVTSLMRMIDNKYADKVWDSHINPPLYSAGDLIKIRSTGCNRIWAQRMRSQEQESGIENLNSHPCLIIKVNSRPISDALTYKEKVGGARVYSVMPIGTSLIYHILECDLKKNRAPKTKK